MVISDYPFIYSLWQKTPGMHLHSLDNSKTGIKRVIQRNPDLCYVAFNSNQKIIATIIGGTDGRKGYLYHVAVLKQYQRKHIASGLLKKVTQVFRQKGIKKIGLFVVKNNPKGKVFWQKLGYHERPDIVYLDQDL